MKINEKCMPALIGGFGKSKIQMHNYTTLESPDEVDKNNLESLRYKLGHYLAGLIEADGSIAVHDKNSNSKIYLPKILIVFSLNDSPLAEKLMSFTGVGKLLKKEKQGCVILQIKNIQDVVNISKRVQGFFRIELRQNNHREASLDQGGASYFRILDENRYSLIFSGSRRAKNLSFNHMKSFKLIRNYSTSICNNYMLNSYLTGLIESSGTFVIHNTKPKGKSRLPKLLVLFKLNDKFLVKELISITGIGVLCEQKSAIIWQIHSKEDFLKLIFIINGFMRTPKINLLYKAIGWFNENENNNIKPANKDLSPMDSNAWLAGFSHNNTSFNVTVAAGKKKSRIIVRHTLLVNIVISSPENESGYFSLFCNISEYLKTSFSTKIYNISSEHLTKKCTFILCAHTPESKNKLIEYFSKFPLVGNISLGYEHWLRYSNLSLDSNNKSIAALGAAKKINSEIENNRSLLTSNLLYKNFNNYYSHNLN